MPMRSSEANCSMTAMSWRSSHWPAGRRAPGRADAAVSKPALMGLAQRRDAAKDDWSLPSFGLTEDRRDGASLPLDDWRYLEARSRGSAKGIVRARA